MAQQVLLAKIKALGEEIELEAAAAAEEEDASPKRNEETIVEEEEPILSPFQPASMVPREEETFKVDQVMTAPARTSQGGQVMSPVPPSTTPPLVRTPSLVKRHSRACSFAIKDNPLFSSPSGLDMEPVAEEEATPVKEASEKMTQVVEEEEVVAEASSKEDRIKLMMMQMLLPSPHAAATNTRSSIDYNGTLQDRDEASSNSSKLVTMAAMHGADAKSPAERSYHTSRSIKAAPSHHHAVNTILEMVNADEDPNTLEEALAATVNHRLRHGVYAANPEEGVSLGLPSPILPKWDMEASSSHQGWVSMAGGYPYPLQSPSNQGASPPLSGPNATAAAPTMHSRSMSRGHRRQPSISIRQKIADVAHALADAPLAARLPLSPSLRTSFRSLGGDLDFLAALTAPLVAQEGKDEIPAEAKKTSPPTIKIPAPPTVEDEDEDEGLCGVCLDDDGGGLIKISPCKHLLCVACATELVMLHSKNLSPCPFCRNPICDFKSRDQ